jgi:hypothetical protein
VPRRRPRLCGPLRCAPSSPRGHRHRFENAEDRRQRLVGDLDQSPAPVLKGDRHAVLLRSAREFCPCCHRTSLPESAPGTTMRLPEARSFLVTAPPAVRGKADALMGKSRSLWSNPGTAMAVLKGRGMPQTADPVLNRTNDHEVPLHLPAHRSSGHRRPSPLASAAGLVITTAAFAASSSGTASGAALASQTPHAYLIGRAFPPAGRASSASGSRVAQSNGAAGTIYYPLNFTNVSRAVLLPARLPRRLRDRPQRSSARPPRRLVHQGGRAHRRGRSGRDRPHDTAVRRR